MRIALLGLTLAAGLSPLPGTVPGAAANEPGADAAPRAELRPGPLRISRVYRFDVFEIVQDGRTAPFRLLGVQRLHREDREVRRRALAAVRSWTADATLSLDAPRTNPRGELTGWLRFFDGQLLSERLLREGLGLLDPTGVEAPLLARLREAQTDARSRRAGLWGQESTDVERVRRPDERIATVCGNVTAIHRDGGGFELHLGPPFPRHHLTVWIPEEVQDAFGTVERAFLRHDLCVTGRVQRHPEKPRVRVLDPSQIEDRGGFRAR